MKGFIKDKKFHPIRKKHSASKTRKAVGIKFEDDNRGRFFVVKSKNIVGLSRKDVTKDAISVQNLGEAIRVLDEKRGNLIIDVESGNVISKSLKKRQPFRVTKTTPSISQSQLIQMQRAIRKKGELTDEDFKRRQEIVRKLNDAKFNVDKVAKRKIDATDERQFKKKSLALFKANRTLNTFKRKFKKEFGVDPIGF